MMAARPWQRWQTPGRWNDPDRTGPQPPLIVTLKLDPVSFTLLDALRRRHFPPERNITPAHLTLFHRLPAEEEPRVLADMAAATARRSPLKLRATAPLFLGRGVAIRVEGAGLAELRGELALGWAALLGAQDRQAHRPHVTIQNKVPPETARALHQELAATFQPFPIEGRGLNLWRYLGGPWDLAAEVPFGGTG